MKKRVVKVLKERNPYLIASLRGTGVDMRTKSVSLDPSTKKYKRKIKHKLRLLD